MTAPILEARSVTKRFGGLVALGQVDFELPAGVIASIIGPNGAGKTTLFNVFTGIYPPDGGDVLVHGRSVAGASPDRVTALGVARTFQNIRLFKTMTVLENVLVGMHARLPLRFWDVIAHTPAFRRQEGRAVARALELTALVGLSGKEDQIARNLAYGDQRRLEIARALGAAPTVLLLDEPTAGMTQGEARELMDFLRLLVRDLGVTVLLIEHNMRVVMEVSDRVTVLDHGEKIAEGRPADVQRDARVIEAYLGRGRAPLGRGRTTLGRGREPLERGGAPSAAAAP